MCKHNNSMSIKQQDMNVIISVEDKKVRNDALDFTAKSELALPSESSSESSSNYEDQGTIKQFELWDQNDFPDKPQERICGLNMILQKYASAREAIFESRVEEGVLASLCLLLLLLLDVAFVAFICVTRKLQDPENVTLLWLSAIFWLVILFKLARRLARLGEQRSGCCRMFSKVAKLCSKIWRGSKRGLKAPWRRIWRNIIGNEDEVKRKKSVVKITLSFLFMGGFTLFCLIYYVKQENLISLSGIVILVISSLLLSRHPGRVNWRPVLCCLFLQMFFSFITLKTQFGYHIFDFIGRKISTFLDHANSGATFVFGNLQCFAFSVLPVIIFFSAFMSVLFYLGIIQVLIEGPSAVAAKFLQTTGPETLNAIANILVSMNEAPLITRPYLPLSTNSELHAIFVNGFASISGSVMAAFIKYGIPANHLLIACVISAPAALAISKIMYPETKVSLLANTKLDLKLQSPYNNVLEAAMVGAMDAVPICAGIVANLIAFLSIYSFFNGILCWLGKRAGLAFDLTFESIFSYVLWPMTFTMGVPYDDSLKVAELIGLKTFLNEFVAYNRLGIIINDTSMYNARNDSFSVKYLSNGGISFVMGANTTVTANYGVLLSEKAKVIATYALCGFANIGSIGISLGVMGTMLPQRRKDLSSMVIYAMIGGNFACLLTGCFAGLFYEKYQ
nr:solute carrier family,broadly selective sodium nucleoside [Hymenolepis microstoma]